MKDELSPKPFPHNKERPETKINGNILRGKRRREREIVKRAQRKNRNGCNEESIRQSGPVAKTPSTHEHVQTHVPGILFRGGDVRSVLSLREGEERRWKEEALERERFKPSRSSSIEYYRRKRKRRR